MNDELKPCPFCGGEAEEIELEDETNFGGSVICCKKCGASSPVHFDRKEHLVSSWNERKSESLLTAPSHGQDAGDVAREIVERLATFRSGLSVTQRMELFDAITAALLSERAEAGRLRKALEPFVAAFVQGEEDVAEFPDDTKVTCGFGAYMMLLGDFRNARRALASPSPAGKVAVVGAIHGPTYGVGETNDG